MALVLANRVQETTTTTGTGTITLAGAVSGFQSFAAIGNANTTYYTITSGTAWEVGIGTYTLAGTLLARTTVLSSSAGGTTKITLAGTSNVFATYPAEKSVNLDASGNATALGVPASGTVTNLTGTASININGTVGATTAAAGAFTTITGSTSLTTPLHSGGTAVSSTLTLQSTSGAGTSDAIIFKTASQTERMRIDTSGNVGIGTSSPGNRLDIVSATTSQIRVKDGVGATAYYDFGRDGTDGFFGFSGAQTTFSGYKWSVNAGTEVMRITNAGNVGIGNTPSGTYKLEVTGAVSASTSLTTPIHSGGTAAASTLTLQSTSGAGTSDAIIFKTGSQVEQFRVLTGGGITSAALVDAVGYKGLPQNSQTASYTLALTDMGKMVNTTTGGIVIPANSSVAFPVGSVVTIYNNSASNQTISITTDTIYLGGTATTGSRTLAQRGLASCVKVATTTWVVSGVGVT